ncbi:hypothetical protein MF406_00645 [Georgenia sp. TF02-10]|nr:hypothetical protein [Georgenia sp. TF02-10]UNX54846.1 hypothetical protein MF406_00645 [Georgenia sp. TF02-10]
MMDMWFELHEVRSADLIREAEAAHVRRVRRQARRRTTPFAPRRPLGSDL